MVPCINCDSTKVNIITYDGWFTYNANLYPIKTKYLKCEKCKTEYLNKQLIEENNNFINIIKLNT